MKKTISVVVALAMVLVMSFSAFAAEKPTDVPADPTALGTYYAELLNAEDADTTAIAQEIIADYQAGLYTVDTLPAVAAAFVENSNDADAAAAVLEQVLAGLESMGVVIPEVTLPESSTDEDESLGEEETLPDDETGSDDSDFLNTILGILGSIGDMIFGSDDSTGGDDTTGGEGEDEDLWGSEDGGDTLPDSNEEDLVSDTGDTTVISVAAVALVAGAALVLTRKKSEDAE